MLIGWNPEPLKRTLDRLMLVALCDISALVDKKLAGLGPRYYSCDYMLGANGRWYLIEINHRPAIPSSIEDNAIVTNMQKKLVNHLVASFQKLQ